ncbi:MAG: UTP--glucose-1-phosphate uridylyltransferase [Chloroflexi bacterium]|nr:UTP--glucose-1-phosphate uridylyltransferase [Chloroflexota bacterium]|tara:strand:+ start:445 stop:1287 length:843 start_codon:yes stop_codon:yes gene_type:complete
MISNSKINWAVIPCAGLGTRLLPVTKTVPKAMIPVANYPIIHFAVKEAMSVGIENILIIIGEGMDSIRDYFSENTKLPKFIANNGKIENAYKDETFSDSANIRFLLQDKPLGVGHAIKLAKRIINESSFAVILPDDVIFTKGNPISQLKKIYDKFGGHVIGLNILKKNEVEQKGIVEFIKEKSRYKITNLVEKPKLSDAPSKIGILGRYILNPTIFDYISDNVENDHEINLTEALLKAGKESEISGEILEGYHFDTGNIEGLLKASSFFLKNKKILEKKL